MNAKAMDIWILVQHREGNLEKETLGLIAEARRLISECEARGTVTAVALGTDLDTVLEQLGAYGLDMVIYVESDPLNRYNGELFAQVVFNIIGRYNPSYILMAQGPDMSDLAPRLAALMETALVTRVMDFTIDENGTGIAVRPVSNGYLFEKLAIDARTCPVLCFLPSVLNEPEPDYTRKAIIVKETLDIASYDLKTKITEVIETAPEELDLEEADIVVSGGRGVGKGESFNIIHKLAKVLHGSVGGTRPIIDWQILPFERQIGQTGKTVLPRLIFACGISGANEYTAGMEKSLLVIVVNNDPTARIFRFADLAVIGDVHEVLSLLIEKINKRGI